MRQLFAVCVALLALSLVGCGGGSIVGKWKPDLNSLKIKTDDASKQAQADQMLPQIKDSMAKSAPNVEFKSDGTYAGTDPAGKPDNGKYTVSGDTVTLTPDKPGNGTPPPIKFSGGVLSMHTQTMGMTIDMNFVRA